MLEKDPVNHPDFENLASSLCDTALDHFFKSRSLHPSMNDKHFISSSFTLAFLSNHVVFSDPIWAAFPHDLLLSRLYSYYVSRVLHVFHT